MTQKNSRVIWNKIYRRNEQISVWPWSDLVSIVMRHARPAKDDFKVVELGCGAGANIPFFLSLGVEYYSVEASEVIVSRLHKKFPQLENNIIAGNCTETLPDGEFDLIFDRGALTCNTSDAIEACLQLCHEKLKPDGKYIGVDWYSTKSSSFLQGEVEDDWTRVNFPRGPFVNQVRIHFSNKDHLIDLFNKFEFQHLEHKTVESEFESDHPVVASWNFVAAKK